MIGWSPYALFALIKQFGSKDMISPAMGVIPSIFAKMTICYNPVIYVGQNTQFRQAFDRLRGVKPETLKIMTVSTTANVLDSDAKKAIKNKLQTANTKGETLIQSDVISSNEIETVELKVMNQRKSVKIQIGYSDEKLN